VTGDSVDAMLSGEAVVSGGADTVVVDVVSLRGLEVEPKVSNPGRAALGRREDTCRRAGRRGRWPHELLRVAA
jgi:hypothetical protein